MILLRGLVVGIMALRVRFERPAPDAHAERVGRLRFDVAAWVLGMVVLTPLNVLIEWQDNRGFERLGRDSQPGSWDPWALIAGGIWALVLAAFAVWVLLERRGGGAGTGSRFHRLRPGS